MSTIDIYTKPHCPYCHKAKALLTAEGATYREFDVSTDSSKLAQMLERSQRRTVPQVFIGEHHIGGSDDLVEAMQNGLFSQLMGACDKAS